MTRPTKERKPKGRSVKKTIIEETLPEREEINEGPTELDFNLEEVRTTEALAEILEQFPDAGITVKIFDQSGAYRFTPPDPRNIDPELIRKRCGAGNFVGRIYINGKYRQPIDIPIGEINPDPNDPQKTTPGDSHSQFLEKLLLTILAREPQTPANGNPAPTLLEVVQSLSAVDQLRGKQESTLDTFIKGIEIGKGMGDGGGAFDWKQELFRLVAGNAPTILDGVQALVGQVGQRRNPPPPSPPVTVAAPPPEGEPEGEQTVIPEIYYKEGIAFVKGRLLAGMDPDTIINWVYDNRDVQTYQPFLTAILREPFEYFEKIDAEIGQEPFRSKFLAIHNGIRSLFNEEYDMGLDSGGQSGNTSDPSSNGKPKPGGVN